MKTKLRKKDKLTENHVFGRDTCPYTITAKNNLKNANIDYTYHNVEIDASARKEMLERVEEIIGTDTPITVPQIWLDGSYVGGSDQLFEILQQETE